MTDIFKDRPLKYAMAKMAKIRKMHIFQNLVLDEKIFLTSYISKMTR